MEESKGNPRRLTWICVGAIAAAGLAVLYFFDPAQAGFYPLCLFHQTTGLLCPGCGGLRSVHQLLHGHVAASFRLNPLPVVALPFAAVFGLRWLIARARHQPASMNIRPAWLWAGLVALVIFSIARNIW